MNHFLVPFRGFSPEIRSPPGLYLLATSTRFRPHPLIPPSRGPLGVHSCRYHIERWLQYTAGHRSVSEFVRIYRIPGALWSEPCCHSIVVRKSAWRGTTRMMFCRQYHWWKFAVLPLNLSAQIPASSASPATSVSVPMADSRSRVVHRADPRSRVVHRADKPLKSNEIEVASICRSGQIVSFLGFPAHM